MQISFYARESNQNIRLQIMNSRKKRPRMSINQKMKGKFSIAQMRKLQIKIRHITDISAFSQMEKLLQNLILYRFLVFCSDFQITVF